MTTTLDRVAHAIRQNPEGLLLLGAGVALMLRNATSANSAAPQSAMRTGAADRYYDSAANGPADDAARAADGLASKVSAAADDVRNYVSDTAQDLTSKASEYGNAASRKTREAADSAYRSTREAADSAYRSTREAADSAYRSTREAAGSAYRSVEGVVEAHPVSIAIAGLAVGCLAAAVFPSTRFERDTLGPIGRRAAEAASETGELVKSAAVARVTEAALKAGEQMKDAMSDRKLNAENIGDAARDAASNFASNVTGGAETRTANRQNDSRMAKVQL